RNRLLLDTPLVGDDAVRQVERVNRRLRRVMVFAARLVRLVRHNPADRVEAKLVEEVAAVHPAQVLVEKIALDVVRRHRQAIGLAAFQRGDHPLLRRHLSHARDAPSGTNSTVTTSPPRTSSVTPPLSSDSASWRSSARLARYASRTGSPQRIVPRTGSRVTL